MSETRGLLPQRTLLLGWGNPGRLDDGLGPALAETIERLALPGLTVGTRDLFDARPEAWLVGVRGYDFDEFGEGLSPRARRNLEQAADFIHAAVQTDHLSPIVTETSGPDRQETHA